MPDKLLAARFKRIDWSLVPEACRTALWDFIENGRCPCVALRALLSGNAAAAIAAGGVCANAARSVASFLHVFAPSGSWGSERAVAEWQNAGGLRGSLISERQQ